MDLSLLAEGTQPSDFVGYLLVAVGTLFTGGVALLGWFGKVYLPSQDAKETQRLVNQAERLDAKDAALLVAIREQRTECLSERKEQYRSFDETLKRHEQHTHQMHETLKEDLQALTSALEVLSQAVNQLHHRQ